jgi:hypothetical protein
MAGASPVQPITHSSAADLPLRTTFTVQNLFTVSYREALFSFLSNIFVSVLACILSADRPHRLVYMSIFGVTVHLHLSHPQLGHWLIDQMGVYGKGGLDSPSGD